jgi:hypothetical protein
MTRPPRNSLIKFKKRYTQAIKFPLLFLPIFLSSIEILISYYSKRNRILFSKRKPHQSDTATQLYSTRMVKSVLNDMTSHSWESNQK